MGGETEEKKSIYTPIDIGQRSTNGTLSQDFDEETAELSDEDDDGHSGKNFDPTLMVNTQRSLSINSDMFFLNSTDISEDFLDTGSTAVFRDSRAPIAKKEEATKKKEDLENRVVGKQSESSRNEEDEHHKPPPNSLIDLSISEEDSESKKEESGESEESCPETSSSEASKANSEQSQRDIEGIHRCEMSMGCTLR